MSTTKARLSLLMLVAALLIPAMLLAANPAEPQAAAGSGQAPWLRPGQGSEQTPADTLDALFTQPREMDNTCNLSDCDDFCNQVCYENGGTPWTCQWYNDPPPGGCRGICWCY